MLIIIDANSIFIQQVSSNHGDSFLSGFVIEFSSSYHSILNAAKHERSLLTPSRKHA